MSTDEETTRIVRSWLEDGVTLLPDRVLDDVLDRLPATPQRRPLWPGWRFVAVNRPLQGLLAVAAVVVAIGLIALSLGGLRGIGGAPTASPSPLSTPTGTPLAAPVGTSPVALKAGSYLARDPFLVKVGFAVPEGWQGNVGGPYNLQVERTGYQTGGVYFQFVGGVFVDPCQTAKGVVAPSDPVQGMSGADLLSALGRLAGVTATKPIDTTFAGYAAKSLTLTASQGAATCPGGVYSIWRLPLGAVAEMVAGQRDRIWMLNVAGRSLVVEADDYPGQSAQSRAEVQAVLDSVTIQP